MDLFGAFNVLCYLCQAIPGFNFVDVPDVILPRVDGEQASVGVIELKHSTDRFLLFSECVSCLSVANKPEIVHRVTGSLSEKQAREQKVSVFTSSD